MQVPHRRSGVTLPVAVDPHDQLARGCAMLDPERIGRGVDAARKRPRRHPRRQRIEGVAEPREVFAGERPPTALGGERGAHATTGGCTTGSV